MAVLCPLQLEERQEAAQLRGKGSEGGSKTAWLVAAYKTLTSASALLMEAAIFG